jgi:Ca-activated chloride channel family protein
MGLLRPRLLIAAALFTAAAAAAGQAPPAGPAPPAPPAEAPAPASTPSPAASPVRVRFVEPAPPGLVIGETRLTVEATTDDGTPIASVAITVDGRVLSVLTHPPYTLTWNAGTRFDRRLLRAVATDIRGRTGEAVLTARPLVVGQYEEVRLVTLYATPRDAKGRPIVDLVREDFSVLEDGVAQALSHFSPARRAMTIALLIDASNSMNLGNRIDLARRAAEDFVDRVEAGDRLAVLHFSDTLHGDLEPTDRARARQAIAAIRAGGGTALYDAIAHTADALATIEGRRVIVLLSDGRDHAFDVNEPGSLFHFEEALEKTHRAEATVYTIGLGRHLDKEMDLAGKRNLKDILDTLALETGGRAWYPDRPGDLTGVYRQIVDDLRHQYSLGYSPANRARDGAWRRITVRARGAVAVQARQGYYAPGALPAGPAR